MKTRLTNTPLRCGSFLFGVQASACVLRRAPQAEACTPNPSCAILGSSCPLPASGRRIEEYRLSRRCRSWDHKSKPKPRPPRSEPQVTDANLTAQAPCTTQDSVGKTEAVQEGSRLFHAGRRLPSNSRPELADPQRVFAESVPQDRSRGQRRRQAAALHRFVSMHWHLCISTRPLAWAIIANRFRVLLRFAVPGLRWGTGSSGHGMLRRRERLRRVFCRPSASA